MDGVSLSKESCRFVEQEKSLYFLSKARSEKVYFEKEGACCRFISKVACFYISSIKAKGCVTNKIERAFSSGCAGLEPYTKGLSFQMTTASSCCEGVVRNQTAPRPIKYQLLCW